MTKVLKNSLVGNAKTLLCCTLNPLADHTKMSKSTLQFGSMAKKVKITAKINIANNGNNTGTNNNGNNTDKVDEETKLLISEYKDKIDELSMQVENISKLEDEKRRILDEYESIKKHIEELKAKELQNQVLQQQMDDMSHMLIQNKATQNELALKAAEEERRRKENESLLQKITEQDMTQLEAEVNALKSKNQELERVS